MTITNKTTFLFSLYYCIIASVVTLKVADTLLTSSIVVGHRSELIALTQEKSQLQARLQANQTAIESAQSLASISPELLAEYEPMTATTITLNQSAIAAR